MGYTNALKGIKKIFVAQIIAIIVTLLTAGTTLLFNVTKEFFDNEATILSSPFGVAGVSLSFVSVIMMGLMTVFGIIGSFQASRNEPEFKKSLMCCVAVGVLSFIGSFFQIPNGTLYTIFVSAGMIVEMFVMIFAISGIINLAVNCERADVAEKGDRVMRILVGIYLISAIDTLIFRIFALSDHSQIVSLIVGAVDLILNVVQYIVYLKYLKQAFIMLQSLDGE